MAHVGKLPIDGPDFAALLALGPGAVLELPGAAACKLRTEVGLRFDDVVVPAGNVAADFAGLYSFWLRAPDAGGGDTASGSGDDAALISPGTRAWRLVFNDEADVWGTQRDPARDRAEIALVHEIVVEEAKELTVALRAGEIEEGAILELRWGLHRWSAPFVVAAP